VWPQCGWSRRSRIRIPRRSKRSTSFPLPGACAVSNFELRVAGRVIRGTVQERQAAREAYRRATDEGRRAALLESERDDVFTVSVGNLPPGEAVSVTLEYAVRLPYHERGTTELRLPLVVPPRYIPGQPIHEGSAGTGIEEDTDQVPDASRITPPRLVAGFDPRVGLALDVDIVAGVVEEIACSQHAVRTSVAAGGVRISLAREGELLDRDFVLSWRVADRDVTSTLLAHNDFGMLSILPPVRDGFMGLPRDVVFILDRSGSMTGVKMASAARACSLLLATLGPRDRFNICAFDTVAEWFDAAWIAADEQSIERGDRYLRRISGRGGTELNPALDEALQKIGDGAAGRAAIIVILTDGQVGNEAAVFLKVQTRLGNARIFTVGVDTAVNEAFLKRVAALGGGTASFVVPGASLEGALRSVAREIGAPLVTGLSIEGFARRDARAEYLAGPLRRARGNGISALAAGRHSYPWNLRGRPGVPRGSGGASRRSAGHCAAVGAGPRQ
jgi:Ca-activated chloride channel homolog